MVLPPPVMTDQFSPESPDSAASFPDGPRILFVGDADEPRKGARVLCRAFPRIRAEYPDAELLFAGRTSPHTQSALLAETRSVIPESAIRFLGLGQVGDLPALYQAAAVTVLPSVWEAYGLVLVESLAAGTPVVGTDHGGIPDVIQGDGVGELFDPGRFSGQTDNTQALAEAILAVLARGKSATIGAACRARAAQLSWHTLGPAYERTLLRLAQT
jgi:phosphatidylinositol alpha-mannosyltransferase